MTTFPLEVLDIHPEAADILVFTLGDPAGGPLPTFTPGGHIDVHLGAGLIRQYSLCNGPEERHSYTIAVKREAVSRGGSLALHGTVRPGDRLTVGAPRNSFPLHEGPRRALLLAGGIGITPLYSMARHLRAEGRPFMLHQFTRSADHAAFQPVLGSPEWAGTAMLHPGLAPPDLRTRLGDLLGGGPGDAELYVCGPAPFMAMVQQVAAEAGWPPASVHLEHFAPVDLPPAEENTGFEVVLARSGTSLWVPPESSIAAALLAAGCDVEVSCEQGLCGTCVTRVLDGTPLHRDTYLTEEQRTSHIALCVSRSASARLVLDL